MGAYKAHFFVICLGLMAMAQAGNINGDYQIANPPPSGHPQPNLTLGRRGGRYFDVYSPVILSLYSQVRYLLAMVVLNSYIV